MNRTIKMLALIFVAVAANPAAAVAAKAPADQIPFVNFGGIRDWTANDDNTLYVESAQGQWYQVALAYPCTGLPFALRVGVDTGGFDTLDNFSNIIVDGQRCPVASVTQIASPPPRGAAAHATKAKG
jgi:hypothetical protein